MTTDTAPPTARELAERCEQLLEHVRATTPPWLLQAEATAADLRRENVARGLREPDSLDRELAKLRALVAERHGERPALRLIRGGRDDA